MAGEAVLRIHDLPERHKIPHHFTASGVVIACGHVLLVHHKRIGAWLPPGGHIDDGELPHEAAAREVFEETGIEVDVLSEKLPHTENADAFFTHSPLCIHMVRAFEKGLDLYHIDMAYLCRPKTTAIDPLLPAPQVLEAPQVLPAPKYTDEVHQARWVALDDLHNWNLAKNVPEAIELAKDKLMVVSLA